MDKSIIEDYFAGKCSSDQARAVKQFLESEAGHEFLTEKLIPEYWDEAVKKQEVELFVQEETKSERKLFMIKIAATILLLITTGAGIYFLSNINRDIQPTVAIEAKTKTIEIPAGKKSSHRLPDGTLVWLNSNTKISFTETFDNAERIVELEGEAFFEVKKDSLRPFRVKAGNVVVTALGTAFNVSAHEMENFEVSLKDGKVKVENELEETDKALVLVPGEGAMLKKSGLMKTKVDRLKAYGWKDGILYFNQSSFNDVVENLERWYGVQFEIKYNPHQSWSFTGTYENETLKNVLLSMSKTRDFNYKISSKENRTIVTITNKLMK
ncbi:MAG: DUF4974 domain-containing protein [Bacteroidales bacterium]|nr:DUF4974 domain-containing protein [Bacteroidales bacterium]